MRLDVHSSRTDSFAKILSKFENLFCWHCTWARPSSQREKDSMMLHILLICSVIDAAHKLSLLRISLATSLVLNVHGTVLNISIQILMELYFHVSLRRKQALLWELTLIAKNAVTFNEEDSLIVKHARVLVQTLGEFIK